MLAAHLRGLLKPTLRYGLRSLISETVTLEAIAAEVSADTYQLHAQMDAAMLPVLNDKGMRTTMRTMGARAARSAELRLMDIYRLSDKADSAADALKNKNTISIYQLYHLAAKNGIFDALRTQLAETTAD